MTTKEQILKLHAVGMKPAKIARKAKCSYSYAYNVIKASKTRPTIATDTHGETRAETEQRQDKLKSDLLAQLYGTVDYSTFLRVGVILQSMEGDRT